ncbi:uncharacterized protein LOC143283309 isoform X2 [Babylonia areolata]|uniref:uncharacterized protein LOC143283309 isoform X2 n=1 Tax=Babylonia areolata TaxID=304850 RepID=UPI003FD0BC9C
MTQEMKDEQPMAAFTRLYPEMSSLVHMLPVGSAWCQWDNKRKGQQGVDSLPHCATLSLIVGEDNTGKTSLAFQAAVSLATENHHVMFIRPKVLGQLPLPVHGMPSPQSAALQLLKFWYPDQADEVVKWCGSIHTQALLPDTIIIDDFHVYSAQSKNTEHGAARLCACLLDAAQWITQSSGQECRVILTAGQGVSSLPSVCKQFHFSHIHLTGMRDKDRVYQLNCVTPTTSMSLTYTMTLQHILLQSVDITVPDK